MPGKAEERLREAVDRLASATERLAAQLDPIHRAATLIPSRRARILEAVFVSLVVNSGMELDIATALELAEELERYFEDLGRTASSGPG